MPVILRQSGPKFERGGEIVTPRAMVATCDSCGAPAAFGEGVNVRQGTPGRWFCGWRGRPVCLNATDLPVERENAKEEGNNGGVGL